MKILKYTFIISFIFTIISCNPAKKANGNMIVNGTIKGLKKGTVYLQKIQDTMFVSVDSIEIKNQPNFVLSTDIESPQMYYVSLGKNNPEKIPFFAEKGTIAINTRLDKMQLFSKITGSKHQELLENYKKMNSKFRDKSLEILKQKFEVHKAGNLDSVKKLEKQEIIWEKRRYLYAVNFAISNSDSEVAPYVALTTINDENIKLLDTINKSLSPNVKASVYGKKLNKLVIDLKEKK